MIDYKERWIKETCSRKVKQVLKRERNVRQYLAKRINRFQLKNNIPINYIKSLKYKNTGCFLRKRLYSTDFDKVTVCVWQKYKNKKRKRSYVRIVYRL